MLSDNDDDFAQRNYPSLLIVVQWKDAGRASLQGKKRDYRSRSFTSGSERLNCTGKNVSKQQVL